MEPAQQEPLEYWNAVEGWVKIDEVREHFDSVGCGTIYKTAGDGRVPLTSAQPAPVQEPVAWMDEFGNVFPLGAQRGPKHLNEPMKPLYTTPPAAQRQWTGLTEEEKQEWVEAMPDEPKPRHIMNLVNVIEAKLKGKNT